MGCRLGASAWLLMCAISSVEPSLGCVATYSAASTPATPHVKTGRVIAIAQTRTKRAKGHPSVPTMQEEGYPGFEATTWYGLTGPGKLPKAIAQKINTDVNTVLAMPDVQERLDTYGAEDGGGSAEKFDAFMHEERAKWAKVVKEAGVKMES